MVPSLPKHPFPTYKPRQLSVLHFLRGVEDDLPNPSLEQQIALGSQAETSPHEVSTSGPLSVQRVYNVSSRLDNRSLQRVAQERKNRVHRVPFSLLIALAPVSDPGHQLGQDGQVQQKRRSEKRVLAQVGDIETIAATHAKFAGVIVHSNLLITHSRLVLDDDTVVRVFAFVGFIICSFLTSNCGLVEKMVGSTTVVDDGRFGNLLRLELTLRAQVVAIVVTQVVVTGDRERLDTGIDKEFSKDGLDFGLTSLEIVTTDESLVLLSKLDATRNEGVLRSTVDIRSILKDAGNGENG